MSEKYHPDVEAWNLETDQQRAALALVDCSNKAICENIYRATRAYRYASLFEGFRLSNLSSWGADIGDGRVFGDSESDVIFKNTCRSQVFAFMNKSAANDSPRGQMLTKGADYEERLKAETLDMVIDEEFSCEQGQFDSIDDMHRHGVLVATAATGSYFIFGVVYENSTRPEAELDDGLMVRVYRSKMFGKPIRCVRSVYLDPEEAMAMFGKKHRDEILKNVEYLSATIKSGASMLSGVTNAHEYRQRVVRVIQGWAVGADKRELFVLQSGHVLRDLVGDEWTRSEMPFVEWHYKRELSGQHGVPLTHELYNTTMVQNRLLGDTEAAERKTPHVVLGVKSQYASTMTTAKGVMVLPVDGPIDDAAKAIAVPKFDRMALELEAVFDNASHANTQISKAHATGEAMKGAQSGVQEYARASYISEAFADAERRLIDVRAVKCTRLFIAMLSEICSGKNYERWVGAENVRRIIKGSDLDLDLSRYVLTIRPVSEEKGTPQTRVKQAEAMLKDPSVNFTGRDWLEFLRTYDTDGLASVVYSNQEWAEQQVESWRRAPLEDMEDPDYFQPPDIAMGIDGLKAALAVVSREFLRARQERIPQERKRWFEAFKDHCVELIQAEEQRLASLQAPAPQASAPPGGPPA